MLTHLLWLAGLDTEPDWYGERFREIVCKRLFHKDMKLLYGWLWDTSLCF